MNSDDYMLVCIAGKNDIAVNVLDYIFNYRDILNKLDILCIVNKSDKGENNWQRSLKFECEKRKIKLVSLEDIYNIENLVFLSLEFDKIIDPEKFFSNQLYNLHFSLLPKYKGMYTSILPILNNEKETGVTLHRIDEGIDTGEIIAQRRIPIEKDDNSYAVYKKLIASGTELVISYLPDLLFNKCSSIPQQQENSTYFSKNAIDFSQIEINVFQTAWQVFNQVRAFAFRPYQLITFCGFKILKCKVLESKSKFRPGTVLEQNSDFIKIATIDYDILLFRDQFNVLLSAIRDFDNKKAVSILKNREYIFEKEEHGWNALIVATYVNNKEIFYYLLELGADIHEKNNNGTNLLMYAKDNYKQTNDSEIFDFLMKNGLDIYERDYYGKTLVDYCKLEKINKIGDSILY